MFRIDPRTGKTSDYATGFTNIIDLDFGARRHALRARDRRTTRLLGGSTDGALFKVPWRGKPEAESALPAGTLTHPGGVAVGKRGDLYVTDRSDQSGDNVAGGGQVLKLDLG